MNKNKLTDIIRKTAIAGTLSTLAACSTTPERVSAYEANNHKGTIANFSVMYTKRESALDAAEANREMRCAKSLVGNVYDTQKDLYSALTKCVGDERSTDMFMYGSGAVFVDALKLYFVIDGLTNSGNKTITKVVNPQNSTNPVGNGNGGKLIIKGITGNGG